jgi:hypothetical protein
MSDISTETRKARDASITRIQDKICDLFDDEAPDRVLDALVGQIVGTIYESNHPEREMLDFINYFIDEFQSVQEIRKDAANRLEALGITHGFAN